MKYLFWSLVFLSLVSNTFSQKLDFEQFESVNYDRPREYEIGGIEVSGAKYIQSNIIVTMSGLRVGNKITIPGEDITDAVRKFWKHGLFSDVKIFIQKIESGKVYLEIYLAEQPRLSSLYLDGIRKSEKEDIEEAIGLKRGNQITENVMSKTKTIIKNHYQEKGFLNVEVDIYQKNDTAGLNRVDLYIDIKKNDKVKIRDIVFEGNEVYTDKRLQRVFKKTKKKNLNIFKSSKFIEDEYTEDKNKLITFYNENGYRDARILNEEIKVINNKRVILEITMEEGNKYFVRNIRWIGNTKYPSEFLDAVLGVKKGQVYNPELISKRLQLDEDAISSLYMDNGYLFFSVDPVEVNIENDSIDLEMRIYEGEQARISEIAIKGNTKTNEHVVRRELRTRPGELFSKSDIIRSVRELATLGYFNPENIMPNPIPNEADGTVDIEYLLEERSNDQLEVSGGYGAIGFVGTVGVRFSNFAAKDIFKGKAWRPVPTGDGQTLSIRASSNGKYYQGYNLSFVEPWLGGKKPNSLSVSLYHSIRKPYYNTKVTLYDDNNEPYDTISSRKTYMKITGISIGLGQRLKWPDDYFTIYNDISFQQYNLNHYGNIFGIDNGFSYILSFKTVLSRSSQDQTIYPRRGSSFSLGLQLTPPYSLFSNKDYSTLPVEEKYKWIEFHKWTYKAAWYTSLIGNLVLATKAEFGYLGYYNKDIGSSPYEKFDVGGSGMVYNDFYYGTDIVGLRGYEDGELTPRNTLGEKNGNVYNKYTLELRYPISLNPSATLYGLAFAEAGNAYESINEFNPFINKRSAGLGIRAFLPMFGLLGIDFGYGFDAILDNYGNSVSGKKWEYHFILGQQF